MASSAPAQSLEVATAAAPSEQADVELPPRWVRITIVMVLTFLLAIGALAMLVAVIRAGKLVPLVLAHPAAFIGIPWAGGASFSVVLVCRASFGKIEFALKPFGRFDGAGGPIVLWVLCFAAHVVGMHFLWSCEGLPP